MCSSSLDAGLKGARAAGVSVPHATMASRILVWAWNTLAAAAVPKQEPAPKPMVVAVVSASEMARVAVAFRSLLALVRDCDEQGVRHTVGRSARWQMSVQERRTPQPYRVR